MTDVSPAVALLFDDSELGGHLRDALQERGARIVHEGEVSGLSRELLQRVGADVLVINLDGGADDALDHLYDVLDGDRPRVVFNDAQASRSLVGWDRARWARHLAVKVLAMGDIDPPRPEDAREIELAPAVPERFDGVSADAVDPPVVNGQEAFAARPEAPVAPIQAAEEETVPGEVEPSRGTSATTDAPAEYLFDANFDTDPTTDLTAELAAELDMGFDENLDADLDPDLDFPALDDMETPDHDSSATKSEELSAELEALLASGDLLDEDEEISGPGLRFSGDDEPPPLFDGNFGAPVSGERDAADAAEPADALIPDAPASTPKDTPLQLSALADAGVGSELAAAVQPAISPSASVSVPEGWALLDDVAAAESDDRFGPARFGVEKVSAADFLAPDVEAVSPHMVPTMSLQLVSMEEAVAPQAHMQEHEMLLDELGSALSRIVLLGAAADSTDAVCKFLDALPPTTQLTFLLIQHAGRQSDEQLLGQLAGHGPLPVRLADAKHRARMGEVLLVPAGQHVRLRRDGSMDLLAGDAPLNSIDANLSMTANAFGREALAIVFSGTSNDAVAGAQAIHDRGGQVWVEGSPGGHFADMVSGIFAERLVSFSGTPSELAAHLIEVFP
ncbi:MAG: chemotaxis protein CheB [Rhodanobacter sp.]